MTLLSLFLSDLERYYFYTGREGKTARKREIIKCFFVPRLLLASLYRISHWFYKNGWPVCGQVTSWVAFLIFGSEINCRTQIGSGLFFPHPNGIVIGAKAIGRNAVIYHQVTIGASRIEFGMDRRPTVGDNVVIGAGAKVLGDFFVKDGRLVKANSLVTKENVQFLPCAKSTKFELS